MKMLGLLRLSERVLPSSSQETAWAQQRFVSLAVSPRSLTASQPAHPFAYPSTGKCSDCQNGISNYCDSVKAAGFTADGGMAEYMRADPTWTIKLPEGLPFEKAAPLMCAGSTIYNSICRAKQPKGAVIAIVGIGGLGQLGVQYAKALVRVLHLSMRIVSLDMVYPGI